MATTWHETAKVSTPAQRAAHRVLELVVKRDHYDRELYVRVREAREAGCTWDVIGSALGMTKQAAHQRYSGGDAA